MNILAEYRTRHCLTQDSLAMILRTQKSTVSRIERGERVISARSAILWPQIVKEWSTFDLRPDLDITNQKICGETAQQ